MNPGAEALGKPPNIAINSQALALLQQGKEGPAEHKDSMKEASEKRLAVRKGNNRTTQAGVIVEWRGHVG